ncbi:MAG: dipeptidase [Polyangiaceae bacterium]|nr:dipeptidase [Polyangiaceae bacterium]
MAAGARVRGWLAAAFVFGLAACEPPPTAHPVPAPPSSLRPELSATAQALPPPVPPPVPVDNAARARELARRLIIVDGHIDVPERLEESRGPNGELTEDVTVRTPQGQFDVERAFEGGLDAPFLSIYVPSSLQATSGASKALAEKHIDLVRGLALRLPGKLALAGTPDEVRANTAAGKLSLLMGMENGSPLEGELANVAHFHARGIRYITLTHARDNDISDSSFDDRRTHKGLSPFGRKVVAEMNRVGIMVDVSHLSDDAFWQVAEVSRAPFIASHSSCRHFTPGWQRNMSDEMIQALGHAGGVMMVTFGSGFLDAAIQRQQSELWQAVGKWQKDHKVPDRDPRLQAFRAEYLKAHPMSFAPVERVADHIDHIVRLVGVDHVGLGSDFEGVGDTMPVGLKDVSQYPSLLRVLLDRGYAEADIEKICSGNLLRVWQAVIDHARAAPEP